MPSLYDVTVSGVANVICLGADREELNWHTFKVTEVKDFLSIISCWTNFTASNLVQLSSIIIKVLISSRETILALICVKVAELTSTTASARNHFLLRQLDRERIIFIANHGRLPIIFLGPLILTGVTYRKLETVIALLTRLPLDARP